MLISVESWKELQFDKLMAVYTQSNRQTANRRFGDGSEERGLILAEQDFADYLRDCFFSQETARYFIWQEEGVYRSAVRGEPYMDGYLLSALETAEDFRRKGSAQKLLRAVLEEMSGCKLYSHVHRKNTPSRRLHEKCGFVRLHDYAKLLDGTIDSRYTTLIFLQENEKTY